MENDPVPSAGKPRLRIWLKRIGLVGFLFFLLKGLVWVGVFVFVGKSCGE